MHNPLSGQMKVDLKEKPTQNKNKNSKKKKKDSREKRRENNNDLSLIRIERTHTQKHFECLYFLVSF